MVIHLYSSVPMHNHSLQVVAGLQFTVIKITSLVTLLCGIFCIPVRHE